MGTFYNKVLKMRKNGRSVVNAEKPKEVKKPVEKPKTKKAPVETAVTKDEK